MLTKTKCESEQIAAQVAKHQAACIVNAIDISVSEFENADDIVGPGCNSGNSARIMTPGTNPSVSKATGIERTPSPICVFIIRAAVPSHPTYGQCQLANLVLKL